MWVTIGMGIVLLAMAALLLSGRGGWLIAGYNTMSPEEKAGFNEKALCRAMGVFMLFLSGMTFLLLLAGRYPWMAWAYTAAVIGAVAALMIFLNTGKRFRK